MVVRRGDVVLVEVKAAYPYFTNPLADIPGALRSRLASSGFQVISIDASALSGDVFTTHNWGALIVSVKPLVTDYGSPQDVASIVAGAAYASGFSVDFNVVSGRIVETAGAGALPGYTGNVQTVQATGGGVFDDLASMLGTSKGTLQLGALALGAVLVISLVRK